MKKSDSSQVTNSISSGDLESENTLGVTSDQPEVDQSGSNQSLQAPSPSISQKLIENEPYLGPAWAVAMLILYLLKETFPAEEYSPLWWFQMYIVVLVVAITLFALIKRHQFYENEEEENHQE